jgi:hypothetical protein
MSSWFECRRMVGKLSLGVLSLLLAVVLSLPIVNAETAQASSKEIRDLKRQVALLQSELEKLKKNSSKGLPMGFSAEQITFPQISGWNGRNDCPFGGIFNFMNSETMVFPFRDIGSSSKTFDRELSAKSCSIVVLVKKED